MATTAEREWGRFDRAARAKLLDLATRLAGDREKIALKLSPLEETMAFASALATARATGSGDDDRARDDGNRDTPQRPFRASIAPPSLSVVTSEDIDHAWR